MQLRNFLEISQVSKILSFTLSCNSWGNSYMPIFLLLITLRFTCGKRQCLWNIKKSQNNITMIVAVKLLYMVNSAMEKKQFSEGQGFGNLLLVTWAQNRSLASSSAQHFVLPRSVKWVVPGTHGTLVIESELSPRIGSATRKQLNPFHKKKP